ncbi:MAG: low molecular weight protein-tyrosine-phosphatase [Myxococcota bacterium]|nr:low molecular weight protein-tyrosine-phosphatase [Myxococcota bacterium]
MVRVCFVCLGNICRSPTAEAVFRGLVREAGLEDRIAVESAGTGHWHVGEPPDPRAREAARARGVALEGRARQFAAEDFGRFDQVVAMDRENLRALRRLAARASGDAAAAIALLRDFEPGARPGSRDVPDPYYGGEDGFDEVLDLCERACRGLLAHLREAHGLRPAS